MSHLMVIFPFGSRASKADSAHTTSTLELPIAREGIFWVEMAVDR